MSRLYGDVLREIVANIATAAFNQDVSKENVGSWCKKDVSKEKKISRKRTSAQGVDKRS
jgi:hypothetical protein